MQTALPPQIEQLINERLERGTYKDATEVLEDAFNALAERECFHALRSELDQADDQLERGEFAEFDLGATHDLAERVQRRGQTRLDQERKTTT